MAHAALVGYQIMVDMLPKFRQHPTRDDELYEEEHGTTDDRPASTIVDSGANGVLLSVATAKRKDLLSKIDRLQRVTLSQAEKKQKIETNGAVRGGVSYQMMTMHRRSVMITLPCHVAAVNNDSIGSNEQGLLLQGVGGIMYIEYTRPDGRHSICMQMLDGEIIVLPANWKGLTMLPEIGQESEWSVPSYLMEVEELCSFLMLHGWMQQQHEAVPDLESDRRALWRQCPRQMLWEHPRVISLLEFSVSLGSRKLGYCNSIGC